MAHQQRKASTKDDKTFFMALKDTEPDDWGRKAITRAHAKEPTDNPAIAGRALTANFAGTGADVPSKSPTCATRRAHCSTTPPSPCVHTSPDSHNSPATSVRLRMAIFQVTPFFESGLFSMHWYPASA
jgi:hypothetical protein